MQRKESVTRKLGVAGLGHLLTFVNGGYLEFEICLRKRVKFTGEVQSNRHASVRLSVGVMLCH